MTLNISKSNQDQIYRTLDCLPDAMIIIQDNLIRFANTAASKVRSGAQGEHLASILGINANYAIERLHKIQFKGADPHVSEYELVNDLGETVYIEASAYPMTYLSRPAALVTIKDVTDRRNDIIKTSIEQQKRFRVGMVKAMSLWINTMYVPAQHISGDFFFFNTLGRNEMIGVIGDVSGKGTLSAMMISSFEVLFHEAIDSHLPNDPPSLKSIVDTINSRLMRYFSDKFIAGLFFHIKADSIELCSCGISSYITIDRDEVMEEHPIRGPFLGMFQTELGLFEYRRLDRSSLKKLILFSDGMDPFCQEGLVDFNSYRQSSSIEMISAISNTVTAYKAKHQVLPDDLSLLSIDLDFNGLLNTYVIYSLQDLDPLAEKISRPFSAEDTTRIRLILSELVKNAYEFGNRSNPDLPITIHTMTRDDMLIIKVTDMAIQPKILYIPNAPKGQGVRNKSGLYRLSQVCSKVYYDRNSVIAEYSLTK